MTTKRRVGVAALLIVLVALFASEGIHSVLVRTLAEADRAAAAHPLWAMTLVVAFSALAAMLAFVSSWIVVPFAVFTWGTTEALLLLWTGWLLGGAGTYAIGRFLGRPAVRWLVSAPVFARYEDRISHRTPFGVVLLAQFALPSEIPGYLLGVVRYPFARYLAALGIVELTYGVATIYLGVGVVERRAAPIITAAAALVLATAWAAYLLGRRFARERRAAPSPPDQETDRSAGGVPPSLSAASG
jgi:uncharacterized membrane protein YdjX (TVP38/TMEM64 family)